MKNATFSQRPGTFGIRPDQKTSVDGLVLAGDWTQTDFHRYRRSRQTHIRGPSRPSSPDLTDPSPFVNPTSIDAGLPKPRRLLRPMYGMVTPVTLLARLGMLGAHHLFEQLATRVARQLIDETISLGTLNEASRDLAWTTSSSSVTSLLATTNATTASIHFGSGTPITATSATPCMGVEGVLHLAGRNEDPPVLTTSLMRSTTVMNPSSSIDTKSPEWNQPPRKASLGHFRFVPVPVAQLR